VKLGIIRLLNGYRGDELDIRPKLPQLNLVTWGCCEVFSVLWYLDMPDGIQVVGLSLCVLKVLSSFEVNLLINVFCMLSSPSSADVLWRIVDKGTCSLLVVICLENLQAFFFFTYGNLDNTLKWVSLVFISKYLREFLLQLFICDLGILPLVHRIIDLRIKMLFIQCKRLLPESIGLILLVLE